MSASQRRNTPINLRDFPKQRELIDRACSLLGKNRSDFILELACREAENILLDLRLFMLDDESYRAFEAALIEPAEDNVALHNLMNDTSPK